MGNAAGVTMDIDTATRDPTAALAGWREQGYVVIPGLYAPGRVAFLRATCEGILAQWRARDPISGAAAGPDAVSLRHLNHPAYFRERPADFPPFMDAIADPDVLAIARALFRAEPLFRCTTLWINPTENSRDGHWHRDSQFTSETEEEERAMVLAHGGDSDHAQIQIALAPSDDVEVVPGSHLRWDSDAEYAIRRSDDKKHAHSNGMPGAVRVALQPGDGLMFNSYMLHRGRYHKDRLRRTLMLTFSSPNCTRNDYFTNQPWFLEPGHLDALAPSTRALFERFIDVFRPFWLDPERLAAKA